MVVSTDGFSLSYVTDVILVVKSIPNCNMIGDDISYALQYYPANYNESYFLGVRFVRPRWTKTSPYGIIPVLGLLPRVQAGSQSSCLLRAEERAWGVGASEIAREVRECLQPRCARR